MTPEERTRAEEITAAIERFAKDRKKPPAATIPGISPKPPAPTLHVVSQQRPTTSSGFRYALIFIVVGALHVAGFMAYTGHMEAKEQKIRDEATAAIREVTERERAKSEAVRLSAEFAAQMSQLRTTAQVQTRTGPVTNPKTEYNIYTPPKPAPRPATTYQPAYVPEEKPAAPVDRRPAHTATAINYIRQKKGLWDAQAISTEQIPGWDGRYRTEFEIARSSYTTGTTSPKPKRYEVITEEKGGKITALEITTKGYY